MELMKNENGVTLHRDRDNKILILENEQTGLRLIHHGLDYESIYHMKIGFLKQVKKNKEGSRK